ncbi:MAG: hypothetical protein QGF53_11925 [Alphaproteobacteria bacterium]|jgi:hypothetical protein|nr:hypothetical protein [Alphaproteobacteria bacterium]
MVLAKFRADLKGSLLRLLRQMGCFAVIGGCGYLGLSLFRAADQTGYSSLIVSAMRGFGGIATANLRIDPAYAMFVVPFLIVATLSIAGVYAWSNASD